MMFGTGAIAYIILIIIEAGTIKMAKQFMLKHIKRAYPNVDASEKIDDDVFAEKERINRMGLLELQSRALVMQNVSKFYGSFCAVNKFSVAIKR